MVLDVLEFLFGINDDWYMVVFFVEVVVILKGEKEEFDIDEKSEKS